MLQYLFYYLFILKEGRNRNLLLAKGNRMTNDMLNGRN